ncbi:MAG: DEAD/DEAH box helicase, partial [Candidatus Hinthialibacter sp.]
AYIVLKQPEAVKSALRRLQGCEISDCIIEPAEVGEAGLQWIEEELERKNVEQKSPKPPSEERHFSKEIVSELEVDDAIECLPFASLGVSDSVLKNLSRLGFTMATPIQTLAIPPAMEGCDLIGRAQTGTGKTLAFGISIVERLLAKPGRGMRALVVAPTRELAIQIKESIEEILVDTGLKTMVVYGGDSILDQMLELREGVDILIATPGRLLDLQSRGRVRIDSAEIFVLDEADRMLDMGFLPQISDIFRCFYEHPQTMLFSATMSTELRQLTGLNLKDPVFVNTGAPDLTPLDSVSQEVFYVSPDEKEQILFDVINHETGPIIIFARTKRSTERLANRLKSAGYSATRIHGDIDQSKRLQAMEAFREGKFQILVATDIASRGLDIEGIAHVINYDLPMAPEDHLHRIGRTARAGAKGKATTFVTHQERRTIRPFKK